MWHVVGGMYGRGHVWQGGGGGCTWQREGGMHAGGMHGRGMHG